MTEIAERIDPGLKGVPETMLWTLHNRATESMRADGVLNDPEVERIYKSIDYDYEANFRKGNASHSMRSIMFDRYVREFLAEHPDGVVVNLAVGLETQHTRIDNGRALWLGVDLPESIAIRERFIAPDERHRHIAASAFDSSWYDEVPDGRPVFFTAQGLLMYFDEEVVKQHLISLSQRFPGAWYAFDNIPRWMSRMSVRPGGFKLTKSYTVPPCPWGVNRYELEGLLRSWVPSLDEVILDKWDRYPRGFFQRYVLWFISSTPVLRGISPTVNRVRFGVPT
ncbi:MAG: class I SAM-dependent methyltransferase [Myxococcota bacterium]